MKNSILLFAFVLGFSVLNYAQQSEQAFRESYTTDAGVQELMWKNSGIRTADNNYTVMVGSSVNADGDYDMLISKYSGTTLVWSTSWEGVEDGDDYGTAVVEDGSGNFIVVGTTYVDEPDNYDAVCVKYNSSGVQQWERLYDSATGLADGFTCVTKDGSNNIYCGGGSLVINGMTPELSNYLCVKLNSSGTQQWASGYDYADLQDVVAKISLSGSNVVCAGGSQNDADDWSMATVTFSQSAGTQVSVNRTGGDDEGIDKVTDVTVNGNYTYVVGSVRNVDTEDDWKIVKLDASLTVVWTATYNGDDDLDDVPTCVKVDAASNVFVTGWETTSDEEENFVTRKYNSSGTLQWSVSFDGEGKEDRATTLELDNLANVIISGASYKDGNTDILTMKLKSTNGDEVWRVRFNGDYNEDDVATNIAIHNDFIFVLGQAGVGNGQTKYVICKYAVKTIYVPVPADAFGSSGGYITNRTQLRNDDGTGNASVKFYNNSFRVGTFVDDRYINYVVHAAADTSDADTTFRVQMDFTSGNTGTKVYPHLERGEYHNYFLGHMDKQAERTPVYNSVLRPNSYTNTDVIFTHSPSGFRHWIVARSGAPTSSFEMTFTGHSSLSIDGSGHLHVVTSLGDIVMHKAKAYTMNTTTGALTLLGWQPTYSITGSAVKFANYGSWSGVLVLEYGEEIVSGSAGMPIENLEWSTCFGGASEDQLLAVATDESNYCWVAGFTWSAYFADMGISIGEYSGIKDAVIGQFNEICEPLYLIFYGGSEDDEFTGIDVVDQFIYACGFTQSADIEDYSNESLDDSSLNGDTDGTYVKFDPSGEIIVDSYIGGSELDHCVSIDVIKSPVDNTTTVYMCGPTDSDDFAVSGSGGSYVSSNSGGSFQDSFIMRLSATTGDPEELVWSTCLGTDALVHVRELVGVSGSLVVTGYNSSSATLYSTCDVPPDGEFPSCYNGGSWPGVSNSDYNGYLMAFNNDNELFYSVVFPGRPRCLSGYSPGYTWETSAHLAIGGNILCDEVSEFPFTSNGFQQTDCSDLVDHGFIMKFYLSGETVYHQFATLMGEADEGTAIETVNVDSNHNIFFAGYGDEITTLQDEPDYCLDPDIETMPICNSTGEAYMETDLLDLYGERSFLGVINNIYDIEWCTLYGDGIENKPTDITTNDEKLFLVGWSDYDWTLQQFDDVSDIDYYRDEESVQFKGPKDGTIARFGIEGIFEGVVNVSETDSDEELYLSPNPAHQSITVNSHDFLNGSISVFNAIGEQVISLEQISIPCSLEVEGLANGLYTVELNSRGKCCHIKFIKQ